MRNISSKDLKEHIYPIKLQDYILTIPFLTEETCDDIVKELEEINAWSIDDTDPYAAPEMDAMEHIPTMVYNMSEHLNHERSVVASCLRLEFLGKYEPIEIVQMFFIKYTKETQAALELHFDRPSNITFTVPLNDSYKGGDLVLPQTSNTINYRTDVGKGNLLVFPGGSAMYLHKSTPVTEGTKYLMVIWTKAK